MRASNRTAMGGLLTALSLAIMWTSVLINTITLTAAAIAAFCLFIPLFKGYIGLSWLIYAATSVLSLLIVPQKETAVCYICAFGIYNLLKWQLDRLPNRIISWVLKIAVFAAAIYILMKVAALLLIPLFSGDFPLAGIVIVAFLIFLLYDVAITRVLRFFLPRLLNRLGL